MLVGHARCVGCLCRRLWVPVAFKRLEVARAALTQKRRPWLAAVDLDETKLAADYRDNDIELSIHIVFRSEVEFKSRCTVLPVCLAIYKNENYRTVAGRGQFDLSAIARPTVVRDKKFPNPCILTHRFDTAWCLEDLRTF
jgi:hypothetical protein